METALDALAGSALARFLRGSILAYPIANALHVLAAATVFGMILATDLRLLGFGRRLSSDDLLRLTLPWVWAAFGLAVVSGFLLFAADPKVIAANPFFRVKLAVLVLLGINALAFHLLHRRGEPRWAALVSILGWAAVLICGRSIAYW